MTPDHKTRLQGYILGFRNDRLGGRLNAILTAMRIARRYDAPLRVFWPVNEDTSIEMQTPEDLFDDAFIADCFLGKTEGLAGVRDGMEIGAVPAGMTEDAFRASIRGGRLYLSNSATEQLRLPFETVEVLADLPDLLHDMPFNPRVREMIGKIDAILGQTRFRSYHLRRGDIIDDASLASHNLWPDKYIPRVIYEWHMKRELAEGEGMIVVFSDAQSEARAFAGLSPRVKSFADLIGDEVLTTLQRDFLELYTMSRSDCIYAPPSSAFSGMAAVIGNTCVVDIEADLAPEDRAAAMEELVDRLENRPGIFASQSDAGQNFPFVTDHLTASGQAKRAQSIILSHVEAGMDRAYVYPFLSERMLAEGNLDGIDRLLEVVGTRHCYRDEHWSQVFTHGALADLVRENTARAIRRYHVGQWFHPIGGLVSETFWYMVASGKLGPQDSYPYDPALFRKTMRTFKHEGNVSLGQLAGQLQGSGAPSLQYPANIEVRDWRRLMGKKLNFSFSNRARIERQIEALGQQFRKDPEATACLSAKGVLFQAIDDAAAAERHLSEAVARTPANPLYLKRLAGHHVQAGAPDKAVGLLEQAVDLSGGQICYRVDLALACLDAGQKDRYAAEMATVARQETGLVELRFLVADFLRRDPGSLPDVPAYLDDLLTLAPGSQRILTLKAKAFEQMRRFDEALAILRGLKAIGRSESILRVKVEGLCKAYRKAHDDKALRQWRRDSGISSDFSLV